MSETTPLDDLPPERRKITAGLLLLGVKRAEIDEMLDAFAHELAEQQRSWALDYDGGEESTYDYTYALTLGAKLVADLIDPSAGPAKSEGQTR